jgi:homocysteine S-methyltransferase
LLFNHLGRDADVQHIDAVAVNIALEAARGHRVAVAGSMSTMRPMQVGSDRNNLMHEWPEAEARRLFRAKAEGLKAAGADFIIMELLRDTDYAAWASEAALETGLPVWIGVSAEPDGKGGLQGWGRADCAFDDIARKLAALKPDVMCVMHTAANDTDTAIGILKKHWKGPIGTYPESGYFKAPDWVFVDVIPPNVLLAKSRDWQGQGASLFGGCCGIGPEHIALLAKELRT